MYSVLRQAGEGLLNGRPHLLHHSVSTDCYQFSQGERLPKMQLLVHGCSLDYRNENSYRHTDGFCGAPYARPFVDNVNSPKTSIRVTTFQGNSNGMQSAPSNPRVALNGCIRSVI